MITWNQPSLSFCINHIDSDCSFTEHLIINICDDAHNILFFIISLSILFINSISSLVIYLLLPVCLLYYCIVLSLLLNQFILQFWLILYIYSLTPIHFLWHITYFHYKYLVLYWWYFIDIKYLITGRVHNSTFLKLWYFFFK